MSRNTYFTVLDTLYYNTLLSSQMFKIDSSNNLQIVELSPLKSRNESIPLDLIDADPKLSSRADRQLITFSLVSTILCCAGLFSALYTAQLWVIPFSILFFLTGITTAIAAFKNKTTIYSYQFTNSNTALFTLHESFTGNKQVEMFVHKLNESITHLNNEQLITIEEANTTDNKDNYSIFINHLDYLYNYGVVNDVLYKRIEAKINEVIFGSTDIQAASNIIYFPEKAS